MTPGESRRARGYTLVALMVGLTIMSILIASVLPLASAEAQRNKEDELIFRGLQYAEGIRLFRRRYGRYPNSLKEMFEVRPRTLRKLWKDPITNSDKWGTIGQLSGAPTLITTPPPSKTPAPTPSPTPAFPPGSGMGASRAGDTIGPIMGVYSLSNKKAYRVYQGRDEYDQWRFTEQSLTGGGGPKCTPGPGGGPCT